MYKIILLLFFSFEVHANEFITSNNSIIDITQSGTGLSLQDDGMANVPIGFNFMFGDQTYNNISIAMNGFMTFDSVNTFNSNVTRRRNYLAEQFPSTGYNQSIKPLHSDFIRRSSGNQSPYYQTLGEGAAQYFVVMWHDVSEYSNGRKSTFEAILYETTNEIEFLYEEVNIDNHDASIGLQYSMTDYVEYLWYDDTNQTSLERTSFAITTKEEVDESFTSLSSTCLENSNVSIYCSIYDLDTNNVDVLNENSFLDNIYGIENNDADIYGFDQDELIYGNVFTISVENDYFDEQESVDLITNLDTLDTPQDNDEFIDNNVLIEPIENILLIDEGFEDIGFEITSISELPIIDIESDNIDIVELEIIEEFFEEEIMEDIEELEEVEEEQNEQIEIVEENEEEEEENNNQSIEVSLETNRQGVEFVNQNVSSSSQQEQTNNQVVSSSVSFDGSGINNQSTQETQQQNTILSNINIVPIDMGQGLGATQIASVEITSVDLTTQIETLTTQVMSISEAQQIEQNFIENKKEEIQAQINSQNETGEYSITLQDDIIGLMGFVPNFNQYYIKLPDRQNFYQPTQIYTNNILYDNNNAMGSLIGISNARHNIMRGQSTIEQLNRRYE
jgi:hypothetical protein